MTFNKWKKVHELQELLTEDNLMDIEDVIKNAKVITYAPNILDRCWIIKYKGLYAAVCDIGNSWWEFYSLVNTWDIIRAKLIVKLRRLQSKRKNRSN